MLKLAALVAAAVSLTGWIQDAGYLERAHLLGSCAQVQAPTRDGAQWYACREGVLAGYPLMSQQECRKVGRQGAREVWRCSTRTGETPAYT